MYIVKVEYYVDYDTPITKIIGAFSTEEKASEYCNNQTSTFKSLQEKNKEYKLKKDNITLLAGKKFGTTISLKDELIRLHKESEMHDNCSYTSPEWSYEELKMLE
jgi:hypothetical protein